MTWSITVHQATPSCAAIRETAASRPPTCSNAHCRARSVRHARGAIAGCRSVQVLTSHSGCGQHQTRFHQHSTTGRPPSGRSRTQVGRRSLARATAPQRGQPTRSAVVSTSNSSSPPTSAVATTTNPSNPSSAASSRAVASPIAWGPFHGREHLVVITDREGPRPSHAQHQQACRPDAINPLPGSVRRTPMRSHRPSGACGEPRSGPNDRSREGPEVSRKAGQNDRCGAHLHPHCRKATAGDHAALAADRDREVGWSEGADQSHDTVLGTHRRGRSGRGRTLNRRER